MKEINVVLKMYRFNELEGKAREKAIEEERDFLLTNMQPEWYDDDEMFQETMNWYENSDEGVVECLEANDYWFKPDGTLWNVQCLFIDGKSKEVLYFEDEEYLIGEEN